MDANAIFIFAILTSNVFFLDNDGTRAAREAYYQHSGMNRYVEQLDRRFIPNELRAPLGNVALVSKTIIDRRIEFRWTFP
jgi:hypothetical protein